MNSYHFRLETVLRVRRTEFVRASAAVAAAFRELNIASRQQLHLSEVYESDVNLIGERDAAQFLAAHEHGSRLAQGVADARAKVTSCRDQLDIARIEATAAEQRVGLLERLSDRRRLEWTTAQQREDSAVLDDFATVRAAARMMRAHHDH